MSLTAAKREITFTVKYELESEEEFTPEQVRFIEARALEQLREFVGAQHEFFHDNFVMDIDFDAPVPLFPEDDYNGDNHAFLLRGAGAMSDIIEGFVSELEDQINKRDGELP